MERKLFVSFKEASAMTSISVKSLRRWSVTGKYGCPKPVQFGRLLRFRTVDLEQWSKSRKSA